MVAILQNLKHYNICRAVCHVRQWHGAVSGLYNQGFQKFQLRDPGMLTFNLDLHQIRRPRFTLQLLDLV
ncbi:hypothetical protein R0K18_34225, partial [Pantoea sp. SIMBA_133]